MTRLATLPLLLLAAPLLADWPQWRGAGRDNRWHIDFSLDRLPAKAKPRWKKPLGGGYGGVAATGGRVYVMDRLTEPKEVERVLCFAAADGELLWQHAYPVAYGKLDYGNGPRSTPTVHKGRVYTMGALGHLHCLDAKTGKVVWAVDSGKVFKGRVPTWGHACSPLVEGKALIVQVGGPKALLVALELETGKEVWRSLDDPPGYSSPVIVQGPSWRQLVYFTPRHVVGMEPATGKEIWKVPFKGITYDVAISDVVFADGVLLAANYWSGAKAIRLDKEGKNPEVAWEGKELYLLMSTPLVRGKHVYALDKERGLKCLEAATGKVLWEKEHVTPRDRNPQASLAWVGESRALVFTTPGELHLVELKPAGLTRLGKMAVTGRTWAHPAFAARCVFARTDAAKDGEIVCVPLEEK